MSNLLPPIPQDEIKENPRWREWFRNLGNYIQAAQGGNVIWQILQGGTGASTAAGARSNLGLGSIAVQNANDVAITGGTIEGASVSTPALKTTGLTGYLYGHDNTGNVTASPTIPLTDIATGYGSFQNTANQTFATANTATKIVLNTTDFIRGMTRFGSTITDITPGIYNVQFSLQMANPDTQIHEIEIWLRKNGSDIAGTATKFAVTSKHGIIDGYTVPACNFFIELAATDTFELWCAVTNTALFIEAYASQTSPFARPSIPSTVLTLTPVA